MWDIELPMAMSACALLLSALLICIRNNLISGKERFIMLVQLPDYSRLFRERLIYAIIKIRSCEKKHKK